MKLLLRVWNIFGLSLDCWIWGININFHHFWKLAVIQYQFLLSLLFRSICVLFRHSNWYLLFFFKHCLYLFPDFGGTCDCVYSWRHNGSLYVFKWALWYQTYLCLPQEDNNILIFLVFLNSRFLNCFTLWPYRWQEMHKTFPIEVLTLLLFYSKVPKIFPCFLLESNTGLHIRSLLVLNSKVPLRCLEVANLHFYSFHSIRW